MRGKRGMTLLGPALLVALALPPVAATGASAAVGSVQTATTQAAQAKAGTLAEAADTTARCKRFRHRTCCKRRGHWRSWKQQRRHHPRKFGRYGKFHHRGYGRHGKFRSYRKYDRFDKFEFRHTSRSSFRSFDHRRW